MLVKLASELFNMDIIVESADFSRKHDSYSLK